MTLTDVRRDGAGDQAADAVGWDGRPVAPTPARRHPATPHRSADPQLAGEVIATSALALFTIAVATGYARVFAGWQFLDNFIVMAIVGHGAAFGLRRLRLPGWLAAPALAAVLAWVIGFFYYRDSYALLLPTGDTLELFRAEIELVRQQFRSAVAPVIYGGGWDVLAAIGIGLTILLSDTFAFRAFARAEALLPGGVLFVFVAALGDDRDRVALTAWLVACGVIATAALRAHHAGRRPTAIGRQRTAFRRIVPAASVAAVVIALGAAYAGPRLPDADAAPIYETRGGSGGSVTEVVSPLVDIRSRLTNRSNSTLFVVRADFESYWRSSALPRFDGTTWGLPERQLSRAGGQLSAPRAGATELRQEVSIVNLGGRFVPAAADPTNANPTDELRWNADSATLLKANSDLVNGDRFEILSSSPRFEVDALQAATSSDPGDPIYFELPDNFPSSVGDTAREVTASATTSYEAALTLQNWFRTEFDYSLEVQAGHSTNAIEGFLRDRIGYCEQFAGTYAAMMRTLGIPARVAVGFTPGTDTGAGYSVLGKNAHAWPEVWFDGLGWVPFEPTPGRGAPGAANYTSVEPEQDTSGVDADAPVELVPPAGQGEGELSAPTTIGGPEVSAPAPANIPEFAETAPDSTGASGATTSSSRSPMLALFALLFIAVAIAAPTLVRRWRRRHGPADSAAAVEQLWERSLDAVSEVGWRPRASATPRENAKSAALQFPVVARPILSLATAMTAVAYSRDADEALEQAGGAGLAECRNWSRQIDRAVTDRISHSARVRRYFTRLT